MSFRLVHQGWGKELRRALKADGSSLRVICPFIKRGVVEELLAAVELAEEGFALLNARLEEVFARRGNLTQLDLAAIEDMPLPGLFGEGDK